MKHVSVFLAALVGILGAQSAHAVDVRATTLQVSDAETGVSTKFALGRKLAIQCEYEYVGFASLPAWQVQLQMDGLTVGTYTAQVPPASVGIPTPLSQPQITKFSVQALVTPKTVGEHKAACLLDPGGKLKGLDSNPNNNSSSTSFVVDTVPRATRPAQPGPVAATPGAVSVPKGSGSSGPGPQAQAPTPVVLQPALELKLKAQPLSNCGSGQDVVAVTGTLNNTGQGIAVIPSGKQIIKIEVDAGVNSGSIPSTGNIAPGESLPVSTNLKAKGAPGSLAGATLKLNAQVVAGIEQSSAWGNQQHLTVAFPANFCKSPTVSGGENLRPAPGRAAPSK